MAAGALTINHNIPAINTHRNLLQVDKRLKTSLEHLSSGERIVRAADGPAALMISEQMRAQIGSIKQAIDNTETSVSMVQTTEASLDEVNRLLVSMRQLAIHAANEGANDQNMLEADQLEVKNALDSIDRISRFAQFGTKKLLDGSRGVSGVAAGKGVEFLGASERTLSNDEGYEVRIEGVATKAELIGRKPLTEELLNRTDAEGNHQPITLTVSEFGRVAEYTTKPGDDIEVVHRSLQREIDKAGLQLDVFIAPQRVEGEEGQVREVPYMGIRHRDFGSDHTFTVASTEPDVLAPGTERPYKVQNGRDVQGSIGGQAAEGDGQVLEAVAGTKADGLRVRYHGGMPQDPQQPVGRVSVTNNSLVFQVGPNRGQKVRVALNSMNTSTLGTNIVNDSGFGSLAEIDVRDPQGAQDSMQLVNKAIDDLNVMRAELGAMQKNALESNVRSLRVSHEELTSAESTIRDADMAAEVSELTRNQIVMQSGISMLSQANQTPRNVLALLQNA